ncbi:hypothetical protein TNIN_466751 [Trichonephila inaurata madagascariensis]|uniref:Uncharacterized protein n=1 Tax=Trichonephila inaurata madagascariensis TaxID=2747483 RepID=A0A8X6WY72_9ARAC|nr:hypothetical protein TNIN_466751 [Trichonephila inaurata madagascariensis]
MHSNVSHTINTIASFAQDDDSEQAVLYTRQDYLYERQQAAVNFASPPPPPPTTTSILLLQPANQEAPCPPPQDFQRYQPAFTVL